MAKAAIVLFADTDGHEAMGRMANALISAKEFKEAGDEAVVIFDGAGTKWVPQLSAQDHKYHGAFEDVQELVAGACSFCANAFGVKSEVEASPVPLLEDYAGHPSMRSLVADGYQVITF